MEYWYRNKQFNTIIDALEIAHDVAKARHNNKYDCEFVYNAPDAEEDKVEIAFVNVGKVTPTVMTLTEDLRKIEKFNESIQHCI